MLTSIQIIDDFFENPDEIRELALKMSYPEQNESNFPGRNSLQRLDVSEIDNVISGLVGTRLKPMTQLSHGKFRITLANDKGLGDIHLDNSHWSGILYMSKDIKAQSGTDFFRHIPTNTDSMLLNDAQIEKLGWKDREEANKRVNEIVKAHSNDRTQWEHIMRVPMKYNRLLLMRPWLWHTAGPGFGSSLEDGRLVFLLFYEQAR